MPVLTRLDSSTPRHAPGYLRDSAAPKAHVSTIIRAEYAFDKRVTILAIDATDTLRKIDPDAIRMD